MSDGSFNLGASYIDILPRFGPQWNAQLEAGIAASASRAGQALEQGIGRSTSAVQSRLNQMLGFMTSLGASTSPLGTHFQRLFSNIESGFAKAATTAESGRARIGAALEGIGVAAVGLGALFEHFSGPLEKATAAAVTAIKNTGQPVDEFKSRFEEAGKAASNFGFSQSDAVDALGKLTVATRDPNEALKELQFTETLAAVKHVSLAEAATLVARAHAGVFRAFKEFGINVKAVTDADAKAEAATKSHATAVDGLKTAEERLTDFEARMTEKRAAAQEAYAQRVEAADQRVTDTAQSLSDLRERIADENAQAQESYADRSVAAQQRVVDAEQAATDARAAGADSVIAAVQRLSELQAVQQAEGNPRLQAEIRQSQEMRHAIEAVASAREQAAKSNANAADNVTKARTDQAKVLADGPISKRTADTQAQEIARAEEAARKATDALADVKAKGAGGVTLADLQEEKRLKEAVAAASAKERETAEKEAKAKKDAADSQAAFAEVERQFMAKEKGLLEERRKTWAGTLDALKAKVENFFAGLGEKFARPLETFGPALIGAGALLRLGRGGKAAATVGKAAGGAGALEGLAAGGVPATAETLGLAGAGAGVEAGGAAAAGPLAGLAAAAGPVGLVAAAVAAVGIAAFVAYEKIKPFHDAVDAVGRAIKTGVLDAFHFLDDAWHNVVAPVFDGIGHALSVVLGPAFTIFKDLVKLDFAIIVDSFKIPWETVLKPGFHLMAAIVRDVVGPAFSWLGDHVIGPVFGAFETVVSKSWGVVKGVFGEIDKHVRGPLASAFNFISETWDTVWGGVKHIASTALHDIGVVVGKVIGVVATVAEHIPGADDIGKALRGAQHDVEKLEAGGTVGPGFKTKGPQAIVGEGNPAYPEYVIATDPKYRSRNQTLAAEMLGHLGMKSGGVLGFLEDKGKGILSGAGNVVSGVVDEISKIGDVVQAIASKGARWVLEHAWPQLPTGDNLLSVVPASFNSLRQGAINFFGGGAGPGSSSKPTGPVPAGSVHDWLLAAIKATGVPESWLNGLYEIAMHESSGDPHSANNWDSNAKAGNPSQGLMQTTISTFRGNMLPGHGDIWNPVDNAIAAIRYILGRYHDISRVPGVASIAAGGGYKPYAIGGRLGEALTYHDRAADDGVVLRPGTNVVSNNTGANEALDRAGALDVVALAEAIVAAFARSNIGVDVDGQRLGAIVDRELHKTRVGWS